MLSDSSLGQIPNECDDDTKIAGELYLQAFIYCVS